MSSSTGKIEEGQRKQEVTRGERRAMKKRKERTGRKERGGAIVINIIAAFEE